ncbi:TetR family transcriptional regulator [Rhodococcus sp. SMB37]|uniref:TetR/AcrR family transcriptional regulator n=1 Tax=Rhodococcus sp. SMB37 TaxID=2512213 RepID=UPI0006D165AB|nr:TetR/AcrR family transcriptional regulator [Rhodococcus sp. SMB37]TCN54212.1 TetR family transcriptional regulator [Rhodococcus sp. SMB37]
MVPTQTRSDQRRARTRAALIAAAQNLLAERRTNVPILEITQLADVGLGSFYNHFADKEELFETAVDDALERFGGILDMLSDHEDPAVVFAQSLRLTVRLCRREPALTRVLIHRGLDITVADRGLVPRARRDIDAGIAAGRFRNTDSRIAVSIVGGGALALAALLDADPKRDADRAADDFAVDILCMLGLPDSDAVEICQMDLPNVDDLLVPAATT